MAAASISASPQSVDELLQSLYQELCSVNCADRGAKLQSFCEKMWDRLQYSPPPPDTSLDDFVTLLKDDHDAVLAQLVISDLRPNANITSISNPVKQTILQRLRLHQPLFSCRQIPLRTNDPDTHRLYAEEKQILQAADLRRACLLIYGRVDVSETQREELLRWLDSYPREHRHG